MAAATFLAVAAAASAEALSPLGSVLFRIRAMASAPNSLTHFWAQATGSPATSLMAA